MLVIRPTRPNKAHSPPASKACSNLISLINLNSWLKKPVGPSSVKSRLVISDDEMDVYGPPWAITTNFAAAVAPQ